MNERSERILLHGLVQGVGMRVAVLRLARRLGLRGAVWNDGEDVCVEVAGEPADLETFVGLMRLEAPPLARIDEVRREELSGKLLDAADFQILPSRPATVTRPTSSPPEPSV